MKNSVSRTQPVKRYHHIPKDDNLPVAIGAQFHDDPINRSTQRKSHNLLLERKFDYAPHTEYLYSGFPYGTRRSSSRRSGSGISCEDDDEDDDPKIWEGWFSEEITEEDEKDFVVRMLAFFVEKVPESAIEEERVRKACIKYYVRDNSISIIEAKEDNSGIVQSKILSRRCVPRAPNTPLDVLLLDDFKVGESITIYGREYNIVDMDRRSRNYFKKVRGEEIPQALLIPGDNYSADVAKKLAKSARRTITSDDMDRKRVIEQQLTGIYTKHSNEDIAIAQQFLKNGINEHLTYYAIWDDRGNISGDLHYCVIRMYLENFSIEIAEHRPENCGRSGSNILVSRQRIPRPATDLSKSRFQEHTYGKLMKSDYLDPEDIQVGETYDIYGKPFFIFGCDQKTREYVKEKHNISLEPTVDIEPFVKDDKKKILFYPPPPNGFGSEKEKRDNWLALIDKAGRTDVEKSRRERGRVMNFSARLANPLVKGDEQREFIITYYRETEELEINEKARRNSGFLGGRFLVKGKHRREVADGTTVLFQPEDFAVGQITVIYERPFILDQMDEGTRRIVEGTDNPITEDSIKNLVIVLKQQINLKFTKINEAFLALAPQGTLGFRQIKEFLRDCSCDISDEEALLTVQNISPGTDGVITYENFLKIINVSAESMDEASLTNRSVRNVNMTVNHSMRDTALSAEDMQRRKQLEILLKQKLIQRKGTVQEQFRLLGAHSANSRMNRAIFRKSLNDIMHFNVCEKEEDMLVSMLFDGAEDENGDITYKQFQEFVDAC